MNGDNKNIYSERLEVIKTHLSSLITRLDNDEILSQMQKDPVSNEYKLQRVKEIIEESLNAEQEAYIDSLLYTNTSLKSSFIEKEAFYSQELEKNEEEKGILERRVLNLEATNEKERKLRDLAENEACSLRERLHKTIQDHADILDIKENQIIKEREGLTLELTKTQTKSSEKLLNSFESERLVLNKKNQELSACISLLEDQKRHLELTNRDLIKDLAHIKENFQACKTQNLLLENSLSDLNKEIQLVKEKAYNESISAKTLIKEKLQIIHSLEEQNSKLMNEIAFYKDQILQSKALYEDRVFKVKEEGVMKENQQREEKELLVSERKRLLEEEFPRREQELIELLSKEREKNEGLEQEILFLRRKCCDYEENFVPLSFLKEKEEEFRVSLEEFQKRRDLSINGRISSLEGEIQELKSLLKEEIRKKEGLEEEISLIKQEKALQKDEFYKRELTAVKGSAGTLSEVQKSLEETKKSLLKARKELKSKQIEAEDLINSFTKLKEVNKGLTKELSSREEALLLVKESNLTHETDKQLLLQEKRSLEREILVLKEASDRLQREIDVFHMESKENSTRDRAYWEEIIENSNLKLKKALEEQDAINNQLEGVKKVVEKLERGTKALQQDIKRLEGEKTVLEERLEGKIGEDKEISELKTIIVGLKDRIYKKARVEEALKGKLARVREFLRSSSKLLSLKTHYSGFVKGVYSALEGFKRGLQETFQIGERGASLLEKKGAKRQEALKKEFQEGLGRYESKLLELTKDFEVSFASLKEEKGYFQQECAGLKAVKEELHQEKGELLDRLKEALNEKEDLKERLLNQEGEFDKVRESFNQTMRGFSIEQSVAKRDFIRIKKEMQEILRRKAVEGDLKVKKELLGVLGTVKEMKEEHQKKLMEIGLEAEKGVGKALKVMKKEIDQRGEEICDLKEK